MIYLLELLFFLSRIIFLTFGAIFSFLLGDTVYQGLNQFLYTFSIPCVEATALLIALITPIAFFYGVHHKKSFFHRGNHYNAGIFSLAFLFGILIILLPNSFLGIFIPQPYCALQANPLSRVLQGISTGIITAFITYAGLDLGVIYALHIEHRLRRKKHSRA